MRRVAIGFALCVLAAGQADAPPVLGQPNAASEQSQQAQQPSARQSEPKTSDEARPPSQRGNQLVKIEGSEEKKYEGDTFSYLARAKKALAAALESAEQNDKAIVAVGTIFIAAFTIILGVATIFLWRATIALVRGADKTAERQLRAYIGIVDAGIYRQSNSAPFEYHIAFENAGQTPGYNLRTRNRFLIDDVDKNPFNEIGEAGGSSIIMPRCRVNIGGKFYISEDDMIKIIAGERCIFIWGQVDYEDAFGATRFFSFQSRSGPVMERVVINGAPIWQAMAIQPLKDGYEAN